MYTQYSHYGYRARIGLIVPSMNVTMEPEFNRMAPEGVSVHASRVLAVGKTSVESYQAMAEATARAAEELATTEPDVLAYGCTSGSIVGGDEGITNRLQEIMGPVPVVTTATAVVEAMRALGMKRISVATPYVGFVNDEEKLFLEERGFEVARILGLELGHDPAERRMIGRQPPGVAYRVGLESYTEDSDGVFISCTNFAALPIAQQLEERLGKPVVTSNQATFWAALRRAGLSDKVDGVGKLLREL
jgi:maleate cis-trans isomerase